MRNFDSLYSEMFSKGHLSDEFMLGFGFSPDRDGNGKTVHRLATIAQEHLQRAKILSHEHQATLRQGRLEKLAQEKINKLTQQRLDLITTKARNDSCVKILQEISGSQSLADCQLIHFQHRRCNEKLLKAFIHCRSWKGPKPRGSDPWPKKKGKAADGEDANTYVAWAYGVRCSEVILDVPTEVNNNEEECADKAPAPTIESLVERQNNDKPSDYLRDEEWSLNVGTTFEFAKKAEQSDELFACADIVHRRLLSRLNTHVTDKVDPEKEQHWCLEWYRKNMARFVSIVAMAGHLDDPKLCKAPDSYIKSPFHGSYIGEEEELKKLEGCYLYYDKRKGKWVRSGKVAGRSIWERHLEHLQSAMKGDESSQLYKKYPAENSLQVELGKRNNVENWDGFFSILAPFCGAGFCRCQATTYIIVGPNVFSWKSVGIERITR